MSAPGAIALETARNGEPTLRVGGRYLHSRHDPTREADRAMADLARRDPPSVVMLGLGLGYHAVSLLRRTEQAKIVVFEPSAEVGRLALESGPLRTGYDPERLIVVRTPDQLAAVLPDRAAEGFELIELPGREDESGAFAAARAHAERFADRLEINRNTLHRFGRLWVRNLCRNLPILAGAGSVSELENSFSGMPALLLAAGPTLDQVLPFLPELAARCVVIAVDTALAPALRAGVQPDFAVVVDPQYWNVRHLDRVLLPETILVSEPSAHPHVFRSFPARVTVCSSVFPLGRALESRLGRFGALGAGGSVSTTAWDLARLLGASRVYTAGLDLGFPAGRTHCGGSFFEELALALADRTSPAEGTIFRYTWGAVPQQVEANDGSSLLSDRRMAIYRAWFASQFARRGAPPSSTLTRGGSRVDGLDATGIPELLELPPRREHIDTARRKIVATRPRDLRGRTSVLRDWTIRTASDLEDLASLAGSAVERLNRIRRDRRSTRRVDFAPLAALDAAIAAHPGGAIGSFLMQQTISRVQEGYGSSSVDEQIDASADLYEGLHEASVFHAQQLRAAGESLDKVLAMADRE